MRIVVTEVGWDGSIRRSALDTAGQPDARHWDHVIGQVLAIPPQYRAIPGNSVYVIHAGDRAVLVGEQNLTGPLHELVKTVLRTGDPALHALPGCGHVLTRGRGSPANRRMRVRGTPLLTRISRAAVKATIMPRNHQ